MTYDRLTVALLSMLSVEGQGSTNEQLARCLLTYGGDADALSVKELAAQAHVGLGSVSRFARDAGFADFAELKEAFAQFWASFGQVDGESAEIRAHMLAERVEGGVRQAEEGVDHAALGRLVDDLRRYEKVSAFGLLKGQAAALDLQVDLLMQGKWVDTCISLAEQAERIAVAGRDQLVVIFSYTGTYFEYTDLAPRMRRIDRPRIWMVSGVRCPQPDYVSDLLVFGSDLDRLRHPYQLEYLAGLIAQEYAAR